MIQMQSLLKWNKNKIQSTIIDVFNSKVASETDYQLWMEYEEGKDKLS